MNSYIIYEVKKLSYSEYTKKTDGNVLNIYEMEDTGLQDNVEIDSIYPASKLNQYANMEFNYE